MTEEYKTLEERYGSEVLTNNADLHHNEQCKSCAFRDRTIVDGVEYGWMKCLCRIYATQHSLDLMGYSYVPDVHADKPNEVYNSTGICEYYERENRKK